MKLSVQWIHLGAWGAFLLSAATQSHAEALYDFMPPERYTILLEGLKQLRAGNAEAVQTAAASHDLQMLWSYYMASWSDKNDLAVVAAQLAAIPGHAQYAGDMIESITNTTYDIYKPVQAYGGTMPRDYAFRLLDRLGTLATPEAIQQIGRFLDDVRNPEMGGDMVTGRIRPLAANSRYALRALNKAVGEASPIAGKVSAMEMAEPGEYSAQVIREWWASDASLPFRQPLPGVALPDIVRNPRKVPHVNLDRFKPPPPRPPRGINMGLPKVTPQAQAETERRRKRELERMNAYPPPRALTPPASAMLAPPAAAVPAPSSMLDSKWLYLLLATALLAVPVWLAVRRKPQ
jgi:hypothetical protein